MINILNECTVLSNGVKMPWLGLGVYLTQMGKEIDDAVSYAVKAGYRAFDTAQAYGNEAGLGAALKSSGVPHSDLFITSKVMESNQGYEKTLKSFDGTLKNLRIDYLDLLLIHWPGQDNKRFKETWRAMEKLYGDGLIRAIGVSNFKPHHLDTLLSGCNVAPTVNQIERHPLLTQSETIKYCKEHGIVVEAWSPIMKGHLDQPAILDLAKKHGKTPSQIVLRWHLQNEIVVIPKSVHEDRIVENSKIFDFKLTTEDMANIDSLNSDFRFGTDPDIYNF